MDDSARRLAELQRRIEAARGDLDRHLRPMRGEAELPPYRRQTWAERLGRALRHVTNRPGRR